MPFQIKRIYESPAADDGARILVDRLWPRGVSRERAALSEWLKEVSPSPALRTWFGHMQDRLEEFGRQYRRELSTDPEKQRAVAHLRDLSETGQVTLLYAARDPQVNHARILLDYLQQTDSGK